MLENNNTDVDGNNNQINIAKRDVNFFGTSLATVPRASNIQRLLEGVAELEVLECISELDTLPYTIEDKIKHNKLIDYLDDIDEYRDWNYTIAQRLQYLELNGFPETGNKVISFVKRKWKKIRVIFPDTPDQIIASICNEIESELSKVVNQELNHEDISCTMYVVFYVFAECKIFEKPPCSS